MKTVLTLITLVLLIPISWAQPCSDLFFSEYIEGSSSNKALEIFNPTNDTINLVDYVVYRNNNGALTPSDSLLPEGQLAPHEVFVISNPGTNLPILFTEMDTIHSITFYNGDDAIWLKKISTNDTLDIIGEIGVDPGSGWSVGSGATNNFTLIRMIHINQGNTNWTLGAAEWNVFPIDYDDSLGAHTMLSCMDLSISIDSNISCFEYDNGVATAIVSGGVPPYSFSWSNGDTTPTADSLAPGMHSVVITNWYGQMASETVMITEPQELITTAIVDSNETCTGNADGGATVSISGGTQPYSTLWNNAETTPTITNLSALEYIAVVTDSAGCIGSDSVTISTNPLPIVDLGEDDTLCVNHQLVLDAGAGFSNYLWTNSDTTQTILLDGSTLGIGSFDYTVTISDTNGCNNSDTVTITVDQCLSMDELKSNFSIRTFPNPSNGVFNMEINDELNGIVKITIVSNSGLQIYNTSSNKDLISFKLNVAPGIYFAHVNSELKHSIIKLIILK